MTAMAEQQPEQAGRGHWLILLVIWSVATALNMAKPFHMDDTAGLLIAEAIARNPLHPMGETLNWLETAEPIFVTNQPHLFFYLQSVIVELFGDSELVQHLMLSLFSLIAIFATHALMRRFIPQHALWATCAAVLGPGYLINQNVMTDVPLLAMFCLSVLFMCRAHSNRSGLAFLVFSAALLTKYTTLFLFPAMVWAALFRRSALIWIALPVLALLGWSLFNLYDYGEIHILSRPSNVGGLIPSPKLAFALVCNLGVFALPVAIVLMLRGLFWTVVFAFGLGLFFVAQGWGLHNQFEILMLPNSALFASAFVVLSAAGLRALSLLKAVWQDQSGFGESTEFQELTLAIWLLGGLIFLATFPPFMATRHALLLMPPMVILALSAMPQTPRPAVSAGVVMLWALIGFFVVANDASFARFYRDMAPKMAVAATENAAPGASVYSLGHWGWQWYSRQAGLAEYDSVRTILKPGDILIEPVGISIQSLPKPGTYTVLATVSQTPGMFTRLDTHRFYASGALALPVFAAAKPRQIRILKIIP